MPSEEEEELSELEESSRVLEAMDRATPDFLENSGNPTTESVDAASEAEPSADETETDGTEENTVSGKDSSSAGSESETE